MSRRSSQGFTLVELLVVIVILGLLLALLLPGLRAVWQTAHLLKCKANLNHIWQAQNTWRADQGTQLFATGPGWVSVLLPYLEGDWDTFVCPAREEGGKGTTTIPTNMNAAFAYGSTMYDLVPDLAYYEGFGNKFGVPEKEGGGGEGGYGDSFLQPDGSFVFGYEDGGDYDYNDIVFQIWPPSTGGFRVVLIKVVTSQDFQIYRDGELFAASAKNLNPKPYTILDVPAMEAQTLDYGMSRGVYETPTSKSMRIDPRLIFILDYPKEVADYSFNTDAWPQFFIKDPAEWEEAYGAAASTWGYTWSTYQSLRHFGKANVLFCDGSVETVGVDAYGTATPNEVLSGRCLDETNPLWKCQGN